MDFFERFVSFDYFPNREKISTTQILAYSLFGIGTLYLIKLWRAYKFFSRRGIQTPRYEFFFGNFRQLREKNLYSNVIQEWTQKYGKTYGYYEGHYPILVTSDLDLIQEVFIKQSKNFSARKKESLSRRDDAPSINLFTATKSRWKKMRTIMNPTFSAAKLRELNPLILMCVDRLLNVIKTKENEAINIANFLKRFTMDTIWNCAFGYDIDVQNNPNNPYFYKSEGVFKQGVELRFVNYLGVYVHELKELILETLILIYRFSARFLSEDSVSPFFWLADKITEIINRQKESGLKQRNYLQLLLEAKSDDFDPHTNQIIDYSNHHLVKKLTLEEIKNNLILFMLAGYETTSTALTYCAYVLTRYPEEQHKLLEEIDYHYPDSSIEPNSDNIGELTYLEMFVKEVLRYYPIANPVVTRRCTNATNVRGIDIPVGASVVVDVLSLHFDKEIWGEDAHEFNPQRFSPDIKRNPLAFMTFGQGPRNCIGMKFAQIEIKLALIKILKNYEILPTESIPDRLDFMEGFVRSPKQTINVIFKKRA